MSKENPPLYALLVGINQYLASDRVPSLDGCVNDVAAMEQLLGSQFGVPAENVRKLTDTQATHAAIKAAFKEHLIDRAQAWAAAGKPGIPPAFIFHYSGHGSQAPDETGTEPDGLDETIVPYDSRTEGVFDIKDWELGRMLDALTGHSDNVTVILDCCHSGSGTRDIKPSLTKTRRCAPDWRPQGTQRPAPARQTRGVAGPSDWLPGGRYVLIAGCRDREESNEHTVREGSVSTAHGALSYFLLRELFALPPDSPVTYRELAERVRYAVHSIYVDQTPQCEGDLDRQVFGGARAQRDALLSVVDAQMGLVWVDGGLAHGLTEGTLLNVYPAETRSLATAGAALGQLQIVQVGATTCGCVPIPITDPLDRIPLHARCAVYRLNYGDMRRRATLDIPASALASAVQKRLEREDVSPFVEIVEDGAAAEFRIAAVSDTLQIQDSAGVPLVAAFASGDVEAVGDELAHIVRYRNTLALRNTADFSELAGAVTLAVKKLTSVSGTGQLGTTDFPTLPGGGTVIETGQEVVFEITNNSGCPLYFALLGFSADWSIGQMYPQVSGAHEALKAGGTLAVGLSRKPQERFVASTPDGLVQSRDVFKLIASVADTDFEALQLKPLKLPGGVRGAPPAGKDAPVTRGVPSALDQLLGQARKGGCTRAYGPPPASAQDEWTTTQVEVLTVQAPAKNAVRLAGAKNVVPFYGIEIDAPAGFTGGARVLTLEQSTRAFGDAGDAQPPPGFAGYADLFQPLVLRGTRAVGPGGAVIEISADENARRLITEQAPLTIRLPDEGDPTAAGTLALAFDGDFYYPVGRTGGDRRTVNVEWLPQSVPDDQITTRGRRGLGRTVKLYLYKLLDRPDPSLGLHRTCYLTSSQAAEPPAAGERAWQYADGEVRYRPFDATQLKAGQRVALFVHGFTSDSRWMAAGPAQFLANQGFVYNHVLTFDYETFNTRISKNGQTLANALTAAGFGPRDKVRLDVFAHSMGTLVARAMIELWGGEQFVDRAFLAGPPNLGTPIAEMKRILPWVGTLALNQLVPATPALIAGWVLKKVANDAVGPDDLRPKSDFLSEINGLTAPPKVSYFILAGRNEIPPAQQGAWQHLCREVAEGTDKVLDFVFGADNDLLLSIPSMRGVRNGNYPKRLLRAEVVPCNHFGYFSAPESQAKLTAWLKAT